MRGHTRPTSSHASARASPESSTAVIGRRTRSTTTCTLEPARRFATHATQRSARRTQPVHEVRFRPAAHCSDGSPAVLPPPAAHTVARSAEAGWLVPALVERFAGGVLVAGGRDGRSLRGSGQLAGGERAARAETGRPAGGERV